ncbi:hypothetical protein IJT10_01710 [bacterium]|nr:hypothetical protein [bacterium]
MEILIVIAIIAILSSVIIYKSRNINHNQKYLQCKANILELAAAMEAYKTSNGFYPEKDPAGHFIGSPSSLHAYRLVISNGEDEFCDYYSFMPRLYCPEGDYRGKTTSTTTPLMAYSYGIRSRYEEYTIICFKHWTYSSMYIHLKNQPAQWGSGDDGSLAGEDVTKFVYHVDTW